MFGYLFLCRLRADDPGHGRGRQAGLERVLLGLRPAGEPLALKEFVYLVVFVAQLLCGLATVTSASRMIFAFSRDGGLPGSKALAKVSPTLPHAGGGDLDGGDPVGALRLGLVAGLGRRHLGLHHRRLLHRHLPVPLLHGPDRARPVRLGHAEVGQDGAVEPRARRVHALRRALDRCRWC